MRLKANVTVNLDTLTADIKARVSAVVEHAGEMAASVWGVAVYKAKLPQYDKDAYRKSIKFRMTGDFSAEVFTDYRVAGEIETGRPPRDLKTMLQTSQKTRVVKNGKNAGAKYLIIPFRHNTPGHNAHAKAMPPDIYSQAKKLTKSRVLSTGTRVSATGATVERHNYEWGGRLPSGLAPKLKAHHTTDIYAGMVRFKTSSGKQKSSGHMTFRIMGEWQSGKWVIPQQPALPLAQYTYDTVKPVFEANMGKLF